LRARLRRGRLLWKHGSRTGERCGTGRDISLSRCLVLDAKNIFRHFAAAILHDGGLPVGMTLAQFLQKTSGKTVFGQGGSELVFVLEFFTLLRRHVGLKKQLAWVVRLRRKLSRRRKDKETDESNQAGPIHAIMSR